MIDVYLFDWGDTLMVDFPGASGKMCDWETVAAVEGAREALEHLSPRARIYIATGAANSSEPDIKKAFERVGLSQFISGYFCEANVGISKGTPEFLPAVLSKIEAPIERVAMVGDSLIKDIEPATAVGIKPIWLSNSSDLSVPINTRIIASLRDLCLD
ncbi:MAG: FMN phosphatase YigB (HAD superfamily) [Motiliproteus sp.]|jgi:FMN phosphatase YigB (HAD superfamily)